MKPIFFIFTALLLAGCSGSNGSFSESDLKPEIYKGYWAMNPVDDIYRVLKFQSNGEVKIYDYSCDRQYQSYTLEETQTNYLRKIKPNQFTILDKQKKPFARFDIIRLNKQQLQAKQSFLDSKIKPRFYQLTYFNQVGAKPLCF